ncbi:uncharacterized protein VICG_01010 [Vittaforma corneae ATCC 50505]|uniref:Uncharacterized protein n=1 Tax=Vittaforma corneae (strain ATCC 50505) TaxID=993615 RepID=L2GM72_VITCO|nr:uncharacterized protein VICG_01010 [Vittaforma corneae ATCC 50505]ELA41993.1 hypothetical protein VICG_01010 [Vittaforma corneae ATCC 50505]
MLGLLTAIIKNILQYIPFNPLIYILKSEPILLAVEITIYFFYGAYFYEIPDKLSTEGDTNVYVSMSELYKLYEKSSDRESIVGCDESISNTDESDGTIDGDDNQSDRTIESCDSRHSTIK